ncbi:MAG TPA: peptide-N4-asparagine amidase [Kofleriaceae bacterium]|nr:peptide-N4-asparagine amidase [Kofleriaceae bacterium]
MRSRLARPRSIALAAAGGAVLLLGIADGAPTVGSPNTATADPPIAVPATSPCVVPLYAGLTFADFSPKLFEYAPPAACPGPWAKVVLAADFAVTAGRQFDRTASIWIGGASVYFGTTAEPSRTVSPSWHVENDLTDYSGLFAAPQPGMVQLDNLVNDTFTGILSGSAELRFYPVGPHDDAPPAADAVLALSAGPRGGTVGLSTTASALSRTFSLPTNVERAFLDVYAQSQAGDEFWYTCVPDDLTGPLQSCGGTAFREAEIAVDGRPAGVAPVYPWIFTGGIDPNLWKPIPGVQTLDFTPYRVDLTPFAGVLSDGAPHQIAISVSGANNFFATTASLLVFLDHRASRVRGQVTVDTLDAAPTPTVHPTLTTAADGAITAQVDVASTRRYRIAGFVDTSHGRVSTEVSAEIAFANRQRFDITQALYHQRITQTTAIVARTSRQDRGDRTEHVVQQAWPLAVDFAFASNPDGTAAQTTTIDQRFERSDTELARGHLASFRIVSNAVAPTDTLHFNAGGAVTGSTGQASTQHYFAADARGGCFSRDLTAAGGILTAVVDGAACGR